MAEYIEREATCQDCFHYAVCDYHITEMTTMTINECPHNFVNKADVVEVVRCCHCDAFILTPTGSYCRKMVAIEDAVRTPNDFCSYGERKDGAE